MYTLYYSPGAASLAVHWMLIELGVPFETVKIDIETKENKRPEYLKLNPSGHIPALIVDGKPRGETAALLLLLAERHPEKRLVVTPGDPLRADFLQVLFYLANTLQPAFRFWFHPEEAAGPEIAEKAKLSARAKIEAAWTHIEARFADARPFVLGERLTAPDFLLTTMMRWSRNMPKPAQDWPRLGAYIARMRQLPSLRETHKREGLTEWIGA